MTSLQLEIFRTSHRKLSISCDNLQNRILVARPLELSLRLMAIQLYIIGLCDSPVVIDMCRSLEFSSNLIYRYNLIHAD